jgi:hypothetical protein
MLLVVEDASDPGFQLVVVGSMDSTSQILAPNMEQQ